MNIIPKTVIFSGVMKKRILPLFLVFCTTLFWESELLGQEETIFGHYHVNPVLINPAATGFQGGDHQVFFHYRSQWTGIPGSPNSYGISYNGSTANNLGIGLSFFGEDIARLSRQRAQASFAYQFETDDLKISTGLSAEFHRFRVDPSARNDPYFDDNDMILEEHINGVTEFDASVGIYATYKEKTFLGISLPGIVGSRLDQISNTGEANSSFVNYYTLFLGHRFDQDANIWFEPSVMLRKVRQAPFLGDVNLKVGFLDGKLMTGLTFRFGHEGGMAAMLGTRYGSMQIFYSYDIYFGDFQSYNSGTHELTLGINIPRKMRDNSPSGPFRK